MSALTRTKSGKFSIENAVLPDELTEENIEEYIIPTERVLD
ncbi:MAG TPA: tRNA pseudouridine(55) synthase TruB, partial [Clostridiales bacterium]|nr:tRNA pseudouridine(55) synthase TruB [Clostridiales bacterium]